MRNLVAFVNCGTLRCAQFPP